MIGNTVKTAGAAALAALLALPAVAQEETLSFAHWAAPNHTLQPAIIDPLAEGLAEDTDGALAIRVYPGGELGANPTEQYMRALQGVADIVWGLPGYSSSQFPLSMIVELPGVVDEAGTGYEAIWRVYDEYLTEEYPGTKPLALWTSEPNILIMGNKEVRTVEDMAGLRIRVSGSTPARIIESLGATPVQMPATEMYTALQTGLIDGVMTGASAVRDFRLDEIANVYIEGPQLGNLLFYVVMNQGRFDALPAEMQEAINANSGQDLSQSGEENWIRVADETMQSLRDNPNKTVIALSEEEAAPFNERTLAVREQVLDEIEGQGLPAREVLAGMTGSQN